MELPNLLGFTAIALAIFTIGLPHIPPNVLSRMFRGKQPQTAEDIMMVKRFLGVMGVLGYILFLFMIGLLIMTITAPWANAITTLFHNDKQWLKLTIQILFGLAGMGIVLLIYHILWNTTLNSVKRHPLAIDEKMNIENNIPKTKSQTNIDLKVDISDILKMNELQLKVFDNYVNYLKKELDTENRRRTRKKKGK
jgi:predicted PurR-regulated permease PerM